MDKTKNICLLCKDSGVVMVKAKRQMGYTVGFEENPTVLEEHFEPCPLCQPTPSQNKGGENGD